MGRAVVGCVRGNDAEMRNVTADVHEIKTTDGLRREDTSPDLASARFAISCAHSHERPQNPRTTRADARHRAPAPLVRARHGHRDLAHLAGSAICVWAAGGEWIFL